MRLNLGCGNVKMPGWLNVDKVAACNPTGSSISRYFPGRA